MIGNAIKFTEKGEIAVGVKVESMTNGKITLLFSVVDTGIGIPDNMIDRIFESFTQADGSTTRKFGGTGLGTTISKELVGLMHGRIWVESQLNKGSTFFFTVCLGIHESGAADNVGNEIEGAHSRFEMEPGETDEIPVFDQEIIQILILVFNQLSNYLDEGDQEESEKLVSQMYDIFKSSQSKRINILEQKVEEFDFEGAQEILTEIASACKIPWRGESENG